ncbi:pyridoxamine 5'-phosphate oxidase family protein [Nocardia huaxiensis]|uniref:Pyridoxamine 5'-phosphate oxidase family protein n=1 Tax=Nocardia huaxiensis TaxID=2755382 RepID=A0A7D6VBU3_9NOCA|nr:pyridoxamine 5'-phosphate oxidase family protein [Nocardia huaxiensis]QLY32632.1 pyridoxamine 5'-phosphate oxidase family protein [Nocardia huaxiensis]UFS93637.1 pyridoxamine 5'-phosphate oxidase family protein [Nocardia huaxiensis]
MTGHYAQIAFTESVRAHQRTHGSLRSYERMAAVPAVADTIGEQESWFIGERDSFYLATVGDSGWPYIQHRGGPRGFLKVIDSRTLGFADFAGNKQYISRGNLDHDDRVALFLMDYAAKARLKIFGRARAVEASEDPDLIAALAIPDYRARLERAVLIEVEAFDWNCSQHIPELYPREEVLDAVQTLHDRVAELERENARLRAQFTTQS